MTRYRLVSEPHDRKGLAQDPDGAWVRYEDVAPLVEQARREALAYAGMQRQSVQIALAKNGWISAPE